MADTEKRSMVGGKVDSGGHVHKTVRHRDDSVEDEVLEDPFEEALASTERAMAEANDRKPHPEPQTWKHPGTGALERELTELTADEHIERSLQFEAVLVKVLGGAVEDPANTVKVAHPALKALIQDLCKVAGGRYVRMVHKIEVRGD